MIFKNNLFLCFVSLIAASQSTLASSPTPSQNSTQKTTKTINALATLPDVAWAIEQIGKDKVTVSTLLSGFEDPHFVEARPDFILKASKADLLCMIGLGLENAWINRVIERSSNKKIRQGEAGHCVLGSKIEVLEKPSSSTDRSMGDIHADGNPHFWIAPKYFAHSTLEIAEKLASIDPENATFFQENQKALVMQLSSISDSINEKFKQKKPGAIQVIEYHKDFSYFFKEFDFQTIGSIEEKPGVPPSAKRLSERALFAKKNQIAFAIASDHHPSPLLRKFSEISKLPLVIVPLSSRPSKAPKDYAELIENISNQIIEAL